MSMRRGRCAVVATIGLVFVGAGATAKLHPLVIYNPTDSAPRGFYLITASEGPARGDLVAAELPFEAENLAAERGYLPAGLPVIKTVWATAGDRICVENRRLSAPERPDLIVLETDRAGRPMPLWNGCRTLGPDEILLASNAVANSFDGRYFGPVPAANVLGRARLIWPRDGRGEP